jgi:hypothetical protein
MKVYRVIGHEYPWEDLNPKLVSKELDRRALFVAPTIEQAIAWSCHFWSEMEVCKYVLMELTVHRVRCPVTQEPTTTFRKVEEMHFDRSLDMPFGKAAMTKVRWLAAVQRYTLQDAVVLPEDIVEESRILLGDEFDMW